MAVTYRTKRITLLLTICCTAAAFIFSGTVNALTSSISRGYKTTDDSLVVGMGVALANQSNEQQEGFVEGVSLANSEKFVGIITTISDTLVTFSDSTNNILVSSEGQVTAYASDINGDIKNGDLLSVSPIKGVLMKSGDSQTYRVVAIAAQDFSSITTEDRDLTTSQGTQSYRIGKLKAEISPNIVVSTQDENKKSVLSLAGESLTGKPVGQIQVLAALIIFAVVLIVEGSIIYGAIHSTISSLGRNPLAKKALFKQLLQVSWVGLMVLVLGFGAIYLILWI
jgi:hypothetical protein